MTRRTLFTSFIALVAMIIALVAAGPSASAQQNPNCCTYTVDIQGFADACFQFRLTTQWDCGLGPFTTTRTYGANGVYVHPIAPPIFTACPPACKFLGASLAGPPGPFATFNNPLQFNVNGCCMVVRIGFDANGCVIIYVRPC